MIVQLLYMHVFHFQANSHVCSSQNYNSQDQCYVKVWSLSFLTLVFSSRFIFVYQIICLWICTLFATHSAFCRESEHATATLQLKNISYRFPAFSSHTCIGRLLCYSEPYFIPKFSFSFIPFGFIQNGSKFHPL